MANVGLKEALLKEIAEAEDWHSDPPPNEASTCEWVILPLLYAAGYNKRDVVPQANTGGGYPDYTVLPNTPYTWYLEAKDWRKGVDNGPEATQALNYANTRGHRWVVLCNGREWLLFDNHIQNVEADKRIVARSDLRDPAFLELMVALSKDSMQSGALTAYAATWRLRAVLRQQLLAKESPIVRLMTKTLKAEPGLAAIQPASVVRYFRELLEGQIVADASDETEVIQPMPTPGREPAKQRRRTAAREPDGAVEYYLLPARDSEDGTPVLDNLHRWLDSGIWGIGTRTGYRKAFKPGDKLCWYAVKIGVVATAEAASECYPLPKQDSPAPKVDVPYAIRLLNLRWLAAPVKIDLDLRKTLNEFKRRNPEKDWAFFVQGTSKLDSEDYARITEARP